jgi:hypothetical protein
MTVLRLHFCGEDISSVNRILPSAPCGHIFKGRAANIQDTDACRLAFPRVSDQEDSDPLVFRDVRSIDLILATHVLQPLRDTIVVCRDPSGYCFERAFLMEVDGSFRSMLMFAAFHREKLSHENAACGGALAATQACSVDARPPVRTCRDSAVRDGCPAEGA